MSDELDLGAAAERRKTYVLLGGPGSGKTFMGRRLSAELGIPFTDLDALFWTSGWQRRSESDFNAALRTVIQNPAWVVAGNYLALASAETWPRADVIVWLDLPRRVSFSRLLRRTAKESVTRAELFPGCRQSLRAAVRDGLFRTGWREPGLLREQVDNCLRSLRIADDRLVRLRSSGEVERWTRNEIRAWQ